MDQTRKIELIFTCSARTLLGQCCVRGSYSWWLLNQKIHLLKELQLLSGNCSLLLGKTLGEDKAWERIYKGFSLFEFISSRLNNGLPGGKYTGWGSCLCAMHKSFRLKSHLDASPKQKGSQSNSRESGCLWWSPCPPMTGSPRFERTQLPLSMQCICPGVTSCFANLQEEFNIQHYLIVNLIFN